MIRRVKRIDQTISIDKIDWISIDKKRRGRRGRRYLIEGNSWDWKPNFHTRRVDQRERKLDWRYTICSLMNYCLPNKKNNRNCLFTNKR